MLFELQNPYIDTMMASDEDRLALIESMLIYAYESGLFKYKELSGIINQQTQDLDQLNEYLNQLGDQKKYQAWLQFTQKYSLTYFHQLYRRYQIIPVTILNEQIYPKTLMSTYQPNLVFFCQGDTSLMKKPGISVVGSRNMTEYGKEVIDYLIPPLASKLSIVSGLARGVDTYAHKVAMGTGKVIAVIGTGILTAYPSENRQLQENIGKNHLLISPLPCHAKIQRWHFPYRNLLIAGLTSSLLVIEAAEKSGSLISANYALQENRNVYAVPGPLFSTLSVGTNQLIRYGAIPVTQADDILMSYEFRD